MKNILSSIFSPKAPAKAVSIKSPMEGKVIQQANMQDSALAALGTGAAIIPEKGAVYSPVDGVVKAVFPTKHALGLAAQNGAEIIIHIGIDTVNLEGRYFTLHVKAEDMVKTGQLLLEFDITAITNEGYILESPVIITNPEVFKNVSLTNKSYVNTEDEIMSVTVKPL
ncbi:MAG: PTS glucose transporter subunit IIA [Defluviitaleaceae bacterium]|nr:PTS glucose transporter subunit IIA [Defluviitaleaceae bacterium]